MSYLVSTVLGTEEADKLDKVSASREVMGLVGDRCVNI